MLAAVSRRNAVLLLILTSVLWSLGGVLLKSVEWHPLAKAGARSAIAAAVIFARIGRPRFSWSRWQLCGAAGYVATVSLFVVATDLTSAANAIFLQYTAPAYVALLGMWLLGERAGWRDWLCISLAMGGVALLCRDGFSAGSMAGILAGLGSGLGMAVMVVCLRRERDGSPEAALLLGNLVTALVGLPFGMGKMPSSAEWGILLALGLFQLGLPYLLYSLAIRHVTAVEAVLITTLEPVLNPLWVFVFLAEKPGVWTVAGSLLVLAAVLVRGLLGLRRPAVG